jgi:hypothetical protein
VDGKEACEIGDDITKGVQIGETAALVELEEIKEKRKK